MTLTALSASTLVLALGLASPAEAGVIVVNTLEDEVGATSKCSLREAIIAANHEFGFSGCAAGSGSDYIVLESSEWPANFEIGSDDMYIWSDITIDGNGYTLLRENNSGGGLHVLPEGSLTLMSFNISGVPRSPALRVEGSAFLYSTNIVDNVGATLQQSFGIMVTNGYVYIADSTLSGNFGLKGGALFNQGGAAILENVGIIGNTAVQYGGGVHVGDGAYVSLTNCTLSGNEVIDQLGGGLHTAAGGEAYVLHSTIVHNEADDDGGGIFVAAGGTTSLTATIVDDNQGGLGDGCSGSVVSWGSNFIGSGDSCALTRPDPSVPQDYFNLASSLGGLVGPPYVHPPMAGSAVIDKVPLSPCFVGQDQTGWLRPQGAGCDIGAYEY